MTPVATIDLDGQRQAAHINTEGKKNMNATITVPQRTRREALSALERAAVGILLTMAVIWTVFQVIEIQALFPPIGLLYTIGSAVIAVVMLLGRKRWSPGLAAGWAVLMMIPESLPAIGHLTNWDEIYTHFAHYLIIVTFFPLAIAAMTSIPAPLGARADAETVAGVNATMREILACQNAGNLPRVLALFSDDLLVQLGPVLGETPEDTLAFLEALEAAPEPEPVERYQRLLAVTNVAQMEDERVGAIVVTVEPGVPGGRPDAVLVLFVEDEGRWLADEIVAFTADE